MGQTFSRIYDAVRAVPPGRVATYGMIAALTGAASGRVVGFALAACSDPAVPCHRVVDAAGRTKKAFDVFETDVQRRLLEAEGVPFTPDGRVDLALCRWDPAAG